MVPALVSVVCGAAAGGDNPDTPRDSATGTVNGSACAFCRVGSGAGEWTPNVLDGTLRTDLPEENMFAATSHIMLAVAVRYAQGLIYDAESEADRTEEFEMLKRALLREFAV